MTVAIRNYIFLNPEKKYITRKQQITQNNLKYTKCNTPGGAGAARGATEMQPRARSRSPSTHAGGQYYVRNEEEDTAVAQALRTRKDKLGLAGRLSQLKFDLRCLPNSIDTPVQIPNEISAFVN